MSDSVTAASLAHSPEHLTALCALWQAEEREIWITLQGGSMSPTILPGTRVCLRCHCRPPTVGDIIAYRQDSILVVHRLIKIECSQAAPRLICLGDGNVFPDSPVSAEAVVGTIIAVDSMPLWQRALCPSPPPSSRAFRRAFAPKKEKRRRSSPSAGENSV